MANITTADKARKNKWLDKAFIDLLKRAHRGDPDERKHALDQLRRIFHDEYDFERLLAAYGLRYPAAEELTPPPDVDWFLPACRQPYFSDLALEDQLDRKYLDQNGDLPETRKEAYIDECKRLLEQEARHQAEAMAVEARAKRSADIIEMRKDNRRADRVVRMMEKKNLTIEQVGEVLSFDAWKRRQIDQGHREPEKPKTEQPKTKLGISMEDFVAYMPMPDKFIYKPTGDMWPGSSVDARVPAVRQSYGKYVGKPTRASKYLKQNFAVEQMTWAPGEPLLITHRLIVEGGWIDRHGVNVFNLYKPPTIAHGDASRAGPWVDHVHKLYPENAEHIIQWCAQRVQRPQEKINHALVLGGVPGIGKDTLLEPVKRAVGPWNWQEQSPKGVTARFNDFLKSVVLRINEAHDLGDISRYAFYDHMKAYTASPPDVLRVEPKYITAYQVLNCVGIIYTTNYKDSLYLPPDDRRHFVCWSDCTKEDFAESYWNTIWGLYNNDLDRHVAAYLAMLDLSSFDPKAPPPKTAAFWFAVDAGRAPEEGELADVLDKKGNPAAVTLAQIIDSAPHTFSEWLKDRKNRRVIPHRLERCGYTAVRNDADARDGQWKIGGQRLTAYALAELSARDRYKAVTDLKDTLDKPVIRAPQKATPGKRKPRVQF
jgi:hypothetical protein